MKLRVRTFDLRLAHRWSVSSNFKPDGSGGRDRFPVVFVELEDDDGVIGFGEAAPPVRYGESVPGTLEFLARLPTDRLSFDQPAQSMAALGEPGPGQYAARCAVNLALLDGAAQRARRRVHEQLGLAFDEGRHVTSFSIGLAEPDEIRRKVAAASDFPVLKLKVGGPRDAENLAALRSAAPGKRLRVDANEAWRTRDEALRRIEAMASDPLIEFIEQPMPSDSNPDDLAWLKERSPLPIIADESYLSANDAPRCAGCFHGVNVKLVKTGGITGAYEALRAARRHGLRTMLGCMIESSLLITAAAHLANLTDYLDLDGHLLVTNDPCAGVTVTRGVLSLAGLPVRTGLGVRPRADSPAFQHKPVPP